MIDLIAEEITHDGLDVGFLQGLYQAFVVVDSFSVDSTNAVR